MYVASHQGKSFFKKICQSRVNKENIAASNYIFMQTTKTQ